MASVPWKVRAQAVVQSAPRARPRARASAKASRARARSPSLPWLIAAHPTSSRAWATPGASSSSRSRARLASLRARAVA